MGVHFEDASYPHESRIINTPSGSPSTLKTKTPAKILLSKQNPNKIPRAHAHTFHEICNMFGCSIHEHRIDFEVLHNISEFKHLLFPPAFVNVKPRHSRAQLRWRPSMSDVSPKSRGWHWAKASANLLTMTGRCRTFCHMHHPYYVMHFFLSLKFILGGAPVNST